MHTFTRPPESGPKSDIGTVVIIYLFTQKLLKFVITIEKHAHTQCINNIRLEMSLVRLEMSLI